MIEVFNLNNPARLAAGQARISHRLPAKAGDRPVMAPLRFVLVLLRTTRVRFRVLMGARPAPTVLSRTFARHVVSNAGLERHEINVVSTAWIDRMAIYC